MRFVDFKMKDLIGKTVVWSTSDTVKRETTKVITKIAETLTTGFRIEGQPDRLFAYRHGHEILPEGRKRVTYGTVSQCEMITEEQAEKIKEAIVTIREKKELFHYIIGHQVHFLQLSVKDLKTIATKLKKVEADKFKRQPVKP